MNYTTHEFSIEYISKFLLLLFNYLKLANTSSRFIVMSLKNINELKPIATIAISITASDIQ